MIKNAVGYIRVGTDMQVEGFSLEAQVQEVSTDYSKNNSIIYKITITSGNRKRDRNLNLLIQRIKYLNHLLMS